MNERDTRADTGKAPSAELAFYKALADNVTNAIMTVDRDLVITYVNQATTNLFRARIDMFRSVWPDFDPERMLGECIDKFHERPEHQRRLLSDPSRLPYETDISVGDMKISLNVTAMFDAQGDYVGNMLQWADVTEMRVNAGQLAAIDRAQAVIEFKLDGTIVGANSNFLEAMGYTLEEIRGRHHSIFVDPEDVASPAYRAFWEKLGRGEFDAGRYKRIGKGGREVWIQASYNPIFDQNGRVFQVVKYATDVTEQVREARAMEEAVAQTQEVVAAAQEGDLTRRIPLEGKHGSIETLCSGVNALVDSMADVVARVKEATGAINTASHEIAQGNADLSGRTENQASSLEETASSMEELTSTVRQNTDNAKQANQLAAGASDVASKGGDVVREVVSTMSEISQASNKIADIIGVIDGIAFQTNILALNAAVEAARAGEQGRGFAVVAAEVRNLAQRSASAAKEIKTLISDSVDKVSSGSALVNKAGQTMEQVVDSVRKVTEIMAEIANASVEQASGIEQVNIAITQMDEVTQQNAALVEEAAAAAESLQDQASALAQTVAMFRLGDEDFDAVEAPPPPRAKTPAKVSRLPARGAARTERSTPLPKVKGSASPVTDEWEEF
ncbi:PAS domain S-box protein [Nitrogeniibacter mangrovi]|uniref:PAS domain S-box protein n=1 Tax=Nitrogeniibacter mangrovi TaxID=2016596 RepID=A0A6C1B7Q7_9RHOO|nr:methyl-accepting chemotaxis protein [Nitrogeniibacter mangrovi]QID18274.1 PAS domain S-box protein [Nitrogeniibacter mangrovi]